MEVYRKYLLQTILANVKKNNSFCPFISFIFKSERDSEIRNFPFKLIEDIDLKE